MRDLAAPVRVTWDLPDDPALAQALWERLCAGRVLFVDLGLTPESLPALGGLAPALGQAGAPRLSLTGRAPELAEAVLALGPGAAARADLLVLPPAPAREEALALRGAGASLTPALWSCPAGLADFPGALGLADECGLAAVAVLNPPAPAQPLTPECRARAAEVWEASGLSGRVALRVHDLFLAEALGLDPLRGYAGCQAGAYLAHIAADGRLLACRTLPEDLGSLVGAPLGELWASGARRALRARLESAPQACAGCGSQRVCLGGCRGFGAAWGKDPSCPGPRGRRDGAQEQRDLPG